MLVKPELPTSLQNSKYVRSKTKKSKKIDRQHLIRITALKLFAEQGYDRTTLKDIAKQLDLTHPALYYYYKSKSRLLFDAIKISIQDMFKLLSTSLDSSPKDPNQQLRNLIVTQVNFQFDARDAIRLIDSVLYGAMSRTGVFKKHETAELQTIQRKIVQLYRNVLTSGLDKNIFKMDDKTVATFSILGAVSNVPYWFSDNGELSKNDAAEKLADFIQNSIKV